ncbi:carcinoembryonic antigen-related cell adhesion molecule 1, partial [Tachysurus ichikawai]
MDFYNSWLISFLLANMWLCCGAQLVMPAQMNGVRGKGMNFTVTVPPNTNVVTVSWAVSHNTANAVPICTANQQNEKVADIYKGRVNYYRSSYTLEIISLMPTDSGVYSLTLVDTELNQLMGQTALVVL